MSDLNLPWCSCLLLAIWENRPTPTLLEPLFGQRQISQASFFPLNCLGQNFLRLTRKRGYNCALVLIVTKASMSGKTCLKQNSFCRLTENKAYNSTGKEYTGNIFKSPEKDIILCLMMACAELQDFAHPCIMLVFKCSALQCPLAQPQYLLPNS